jgi:hypothetical protein
MGTGLQHFFVAKTLEHNAGKMEICTCARIISACFEFSQVRLGANSKNFETTERSDYIPHT